MSNLKLFFLAVILLVFNSAFAQTGVMNSLMCDLRIPSGEIRYRLEIMKRTETMSVIYVFDQYANPVSWMNAKTDLILPIINNDLSKMHNLVIHDPSRMTTLSFSIDGINIHGKTRLSAIYKNSKRSFNFGGCFAAALPYR